MTRTIEHDLPRWEADDVRTPRGVLPARPGDDRLVGRTALLARAAALTTARATTRRPTPRDLLAAIRTPLDDLVAG